MWAVSYNNFFGLSYLWTMYSYFIIPLHYLGRYLLTFQTMMVSLPIPKTFLPEASGAVVSVTVCAYRFSFPCVAGSACAANGSLTCLLRGNDPQRPPRNILRAILIFTTQYDLIQPSTNKFALCYPLKPLNSLWTSVVFKTLLYRITSSVSISIKCLMVKKDF